jgi:hypothetical protein
MWGVASELKQLAEFSKGGGRVDHFPPGHYASHKF